VHAARLFIDVAPGNQVFLQQ